MSNDKPPSGENPSNPIGLDRSVTETVVPGGHGSRLDLSAEPTLPAAETIGRYAVISHVGSGGMGSVYVAFDPDLDRKVALKLVRPDREGPREQARLLQEARAMAQVTHPNVVRIYDVGVHGGQVFFTMEFVAGRNLLGWLRERQPSWRQVVRLFRGIARGLQAAHAQGLVHRDLKPENILVGEGETPQIADFGLVRSLGPRPDSAEEAESAAESPLTASDETSSLMGTPAYMAPELLLGQPADERSDQYSFCVALSRALAGQPPRQSEGGRQSSSGKGFPARLRRILDQGLSPDPSDRFPSMAALELQLGRLSRRWRWRWSLFGASAVLLLSAPLWLSYLERSRTPVCGGGEESLVGVWDEGRRQSLEATFRAMDSSFSEEVLGGIVPVLDQYRTDWIDAHGEFCRATKIRGEQSEQLLDLQMLCLERRREEFRGVTDFLLSAGKEILPRALQLTEGLSSIDDCADRAELVLLSPLPQDAEKRREIEQIQAEVVRARVRSEVREKIDVDRIRESVAAAEGIGYSPLVADARRELALVLLWQVGDSGAAVENLEAALRAAIAGNNRFQVAELYARLAEVNAFNLGDPERGQWWADIAEAALEALGPNRRREQFLGHASLGLAAWSTQRWEKAEAHWQSALELARATRGPASAGTAEMLNNLALIETKSVDERLGYLTSALEIKESSYGTWNPLLANTLVNQGAILDSIGLYEEALLHAQRASVVLERFYGEHRDQAYPWILEAGILNHLDRPQEAEALLEDAFLVVADFGEQHPVRFELFMFRLESLILQRRLPEAEEVYRETAAVGASFPAGSSLLRGLQLARGRLDLLSGRTEQALSVLQEAISSAEAEEIRLSNWEAVSLPLALGQAWVGLGNPARGLPRLEQAVERAGRLEVEPALRGASRLALAKAIRSLDEERARALVEAAAEDLATPGSAWSHRLADQVASWQ